MGEPREGSDDERGEGADDGAGTGEPTVTDEQTVAGGRPCPRCDRPMIHRHCKYVCPEHGVVYDCSDTFY